MQKTLREIVAVDKASRIDVEKAVARREAIVEQVNKKREEYDKKYKSEATETIDAARLKAENELASECERIRSETSSKSEQLKKSFEKHHAFWEDSIVKRILG
ncbi:MAG: hypothetical protein IJL63_02490 [Clostridia bacterium]|nr:hypothetical protein [Clostridia bacterium]